MAPHKFAKLSLVLMLSASLISAQFPLSIPPAVAAAVALSQSSNWIHATSKNREVEAQETKEIIEFLWPLAKNTNQDRLVYYDQQKTEEIKQSNFKTSSKTVPAAKSSAKSRKSRRNQSVSSARQPVAPTSTPTPIPATTIPTPQAPFDSGLAIVYVDSDRWSSFRGLNGEVPKQAVSAIIRAPYAKLEQSDDGKSRVLVNGPLSKVHPAAVHKVKEEKPAKPTQRVESAKVAQEEETVPRMYDFSYDTIDQLGNQLAGLDDGYYAYQDKNGVIRIVNIKSADYPTSANAKSNGGPGLSIPESSEVTEYLPPELAYFQRGFQAIPAESVPIDAPVDRYYGRSAYSDSRQNDYELVPFDANNGDPFGDFFNHKK